MEVGPALSNFSPTATLTLSYILRPRSGLRAAGGGSRPRSGRQLAVVASENATDACAPIARPPRAPRSEDMVGNPSPSSPGVYAGRRPRCRRRGRSDGGRRGRGRQSSSRPRCPPSPPLSQTLPSLLRGLFRPWGRRRTHPCWSHHASPRTPTGLVARQRPRRRPVRGRAGDCFMGEVCHLDRRLCVPPRSTLLPARPPPSSTPVEATQRWRGYGRRPSPHGRKAGAWPAAAASPLE